MLRVALFPAQDNDGCALYRMRAPVAVLEAAGDVEVTVPRDIEDPQERRRALDADVFVFQRPAHRHISDTIPGLQARGIAVVIDIDDDLASLDPKHPMFSELHPAVNPEVNWQHIKRACQLADLVTVSTPALVRRYGGPRARVIPNFVPEALLDVEAPRDGRTVGWASSTVTHVDDLAVTHGGVAQALSDTGARFRLVGREASEVKRQLGLPSEPEVVPWVPIDEYPRQVARFDVGIVPLRETLFCRSKSALKGLELAALGVPFVASPLPDYVRVHNDGIGILAERSRDWRREVRRLLQDPAWAEEVAAQAESAVERSHLLEKNAWRWLECWSDAVELRRKTPLARAA